MKTIAFGALALSLGFAGTAQAQVVQGGASADTVATVGLPDAAATTDDVTERARAAVESAQARTQTTTDSAAQGLDRAQQKLEDNADAASHAEAGAGAHATVETPAADAEVHGQAHVKADNGPE